MDIALLPILDGGGIKTKIIDALASGVPVVTTPKGAEGLNKLSKGFIGIGRTPGELVTEMLNLMQDHDLRREKSERAKCFIDGEHSYDALLGKLAQCYSYL